MPQKLTIKTDVKLGTVLPATPVIPAEGLKVWGQSDNLVTLCLKGEKASDVAQR